jgi:hypothetical protein
VGKFAATSRVVGTVICCHGCCANRVKGTMNNKKESLKPVENLAFLRYAFR